LCSSQKFESGEATTIQILSDWLPVISVYNADGSLFDVPAVNLINTTIINPDITASVYQTTFDFTTYPVGGYVIQIVYTDDAAVVHTWQSRAISVAISWNDTICIDYSNDENTNETVWNTGIQCRTRVEGSCIEFTPEFQGNTYTDQLINATALPRNAFQTFNATFGKSPGIPDWFGNMINFIMMLTDVKIDGTFYQIIDGSKWEVSRQPPLRLGDPTMAGYSIKVMPVDNALLARLKNGGITVNGLKVIEKVEPYFNIGTNQTLAVSKWDMLTEITFSEVNIAFNVTLTVGATVLGVWPVPVSVTNDDSYTIDLRKFFTNPGALSLSVTGMTGVAGLSLDMFIEYRSFAATVQPVGTTPGTTTAYKPGSVIEYAEVNPGDFGNDFDVTTGLGQTTGNYPNFAICDGRNGTPDKTDRYSIGWKPDGSIGNIGDPLGSANINLTNVNQLPLTKINVQLAENGTGNGSAGAAARSDNESVARAILPSYPDTQDPTNPATYGQNIPNNPLSIVSCFIMCLS
jgi:hypothetical protein